MSYHGIKEPKMDNIKCSIVQTVVLVDDNLFDTVQQGFGLGLQGLTQSQNDLCGIECTPTNR